MGGGTGYVSSWSSGQEKDKLDKLENIARDELKKEPPVERRKVFISFRHEDKLLVDSLRGQAKNENSNLDFIDMSLQVPFNSENAEYIKQGIRARINQSSVTIVMMTDKTHESDWVNWEINESIKLGKGVVVIDKRDSNGKMPDAVTQNSGQVKVVPYKHEEIMKAIDEAASSH